MFRRLILLFVILINTDASAQDLSKAPANFAYQDGKAVFIDVLRTYTEITFDVASRKATATSSMWFLTGAEDGYPIFDLVPNPTSMKLNSQSTASAVVADPDGETRYRIIKTKAPAYSLNYLEIAYDYPSSEITWDSGSASTLWSTDDLSSGGRNFMEQYMPANTEFDQFQAELKVTVTGGGQHEIFTNGSLQALAANAWHISFPYWYTSSGHYFHLTPKGKFAVATGFVNGSRQIPIITYSSSQSLADRALTSAKSVILELERDYGPYSHNSFVGLITSSGGGMEHCGAAITSLGALGHEIFHSWFARSVMPKDGNSGWMDEGMASWRDNGYPRASSGPNRQPVNLSGHSQYRRHTDGGSYAQGSKFLSELDYVFRDLGGMRALIKQKKWQHQKN